MKNFFILSVLISFTILTACNKQEMEDVLVPANQEVPALPANNKVDNHDFSNTVNDGKANFMINNKDNIPKTPLIKDSVENPWLGIMISVPDSTSVFSSINSWPKDNDATNKANITSVFFINIVEESLIFPFFFEFRLEFQKLFRILHFLTLLEV